VKKKKKDICKGLVFKLHVFFQTPLIWDCSGTLADTVPEESNLQ